MEKSKFSIMKSIFKKFFFRGDNPNSGDNIKSGIPFVANVYGVKMELNPNEYIDSSIYNGTFETDTIKAFEKLFKKDDVFFDIGANVGFYSLLAAKYLGAKGKIIAFEPTQYGYNKTLRNVSLNTFENIIVEKIALSDTNGEKEMFFNSSWPIDNKFDQKEKSNELLAFETLDSYVERNNIKKINLIKIDVDGFEYKIMKGAKQTLKNMAPVLVLEICGYTLKRNGDSVAELINFLKELGYRFFSEKQFKPFQNLQAEVIDNPILETSSFNIIVSKDDFN